MTGAEPTQSQTHTSTTLLVQVAEGADGPAVATFVARYGALVAAVCRKCGLSAEDTDDVRQEVMLAAVQGLRREKYRRELGRFKSWFKGLTYHKVRDMQAQRARVQARTAGRNGQAAGRATNAPSACEGLPVAGVAGTECRPGFPDDTASLEATEPGAAGTDGSSGARLFSERDLLETIPDPHPGPDAVFEAEFETQWQTAALDDALDEIRREVDPGTFQAFDLYVRKNVPPRRVAKMLSMTRNAVYLAKNRVMARLREKLRG